jgi:hypothetical protein
MQPHDISGESSDFGDDNMMSEEDKKLMEEAKHCSSCLEWHKHCQAECCKTIIVNITKGEYDASEGRIRMRSFVLPDMQRYYEFHGVRCCRGILFFRKDKIIEVKGKYVYVQPCVMLTDDLKCKLHNKNKPKICVILDEDYAKGKHKELVVTDNCLFKYKIMEGDKNGL